MSEARSTRRRLLEGAGILVALALAFWMGLRIEPPSGTRSGVVMGDGPDVSAFAVRNSSGQTVALVERGTPAVVMISSESCTFCRRALQDVAALAEGRAVPRLFMLTLDGADASAAMAREAGVQGAQHTGPVGPRERALLELQTPGTPTFLYVDVNGRATIFLPGYPGREGLRVWVAVMTGEATTVLPSSDTRVQQTPLSGS